MGGEEPCALLEQKEDCRGIVGKDLREHTFSQAIEGQDGVTRTFCDNVGEDFSGRQQKVFFQNNQLFKTVDNDLVNNELKLVGKKLVMSRLE